MLKRLCFSLAAAAGCYFLAQTTCAPFPADRLPAPQVVEVEIPSKALVFAGQLGGMNRGWLSDHSGGAIEQITLAEWYDRARAADGSSVVPLMFFDRCGGMELWLLTRGGGRDGASVAVGVLWTGVKGYRNWGLGLWWSVSTEGIIVDRDAGLVSYWPSGEGGVLRILLFIPIFALFIVAFA